MQKVLIISALVFVAGGVWYVAGMSSAPSTNNETELTEQTTETENEPLTGMGSFTDLMGLGQSIRCEFSNTLEDQVISGTFYSDGERFRVESTGQTPEGTMVSNMINDSEYTYTWGSSPQGSMAVKMANQDSVANGDSIESTEPETSQVNVDVDVTYDCRRWNVDASLFVPPSDVEFMDMAAMMNEAFSNMPEGFELPEGFPQTQ